MADERDAKIAVEDLNGTTMDGQEIKVEISHGEYRIHRVYLKSFLLCLLSL